MGTEHEFVLDDLGLLAPIEDIERALGQLNCSTQCRQNCFIQKLIDARRAHTNALQRFDDLLELIARTPSECPLSG
ncbi:MAG: hypothetical protein CVV05_00460 [Gammaproteobacteria bacterium HGW-Gammaproteobacteria-1]|jgi:hypothetical protein|nr:MAG: hypothetical protein CVV05_00460 [Gammaproteobacteria bacterium HGW-Gammaproteobacteria-1]